MTPGQAYAQWLHRRRTVYDTVSDRLFYNGFGWERKPVGWHPLGVVPLEAPPERPRRVRKPAEEADK